MNRVIRRAITAVVMAVACSIVSFAQCNSILPGFGSWGSVTAVEHGNTNPFAASYPPLAIGSRVVLRGYFPGLSATSYYAGGSVYDAQGLRIYINNECYPARWTYQSNTRLEFEFPVNMNPGNHTIHLYKNSYGGYVWRSTKNIVRYSPAFIFGPPEEYGQPNTVSCVIFARSPGGATRPVTACTKHQSIQAGISPSEEILLRFNVTGAYPGTSGQPPRTANFDGIPSTSIQISIAGPPFSNGEQYIDILIPQAARSPGVKSMNVSVGGVPAALTPKILF